MAHKITAFIKPPWLKVLAPAIVILLCFAFNLFFKPFHQSSRNPLHIEFLRHLMVQECGLYTLLGSKPITLFEIQLGPPQNEEELRVQYEKLRIFLEEAEEQKHLPLSKRTANNLNNAPLPKYRDYKRSWEKELKKTSHPKHLWQAWTAEPLPLDPKFLIFSRKNAFNDSPMGVFVNVPNLVWILHHYQNEFSKRTELSFAPETIVYEIQNEDSLFWTRVFKDHFLVGLICGYGEKSSFLFDWGGKYFPSITHDKMRQFSSKDFIKKIPKRIYTKKNVAASDLPSPMFFHFGVYDPMDQCYLQEREKIISFFKGKDFTDTVFEVLQGFPEREN